MAREIRQVEHVHGWVRSRAGLRLVGQKAKPGCHRGNAPSGSSLGAERIWESVPLQSRLLT